MSDTANNFNNEFKKFQEISKNQAERHRDAANAEIAGLHPSRSTRMGAERIVRKVHGRAGTCMPPICLMPRANNNQDRLWRHES